MNVKIMTLFKDNIPLLQQYIESLFTNTVHPFELILIDNGSSQEVKQDLLRLIPSKIKLINLNFPVSFSEGNNLAIEMFRGNADLFVLCNNDILFEMGWLTKIVQYYEKDIQNLGHIVAPAIKTNGLIYKGGLVTIQNNQLNARWVNVNEDIEPNYLQGCCLAIPDVVIDKIGIFDTNFNWYFEDVDLCYRSIQLGCKLVTLQDVIIEHLHAKSTNPQLKQQRMDKSKQYFIKKWSDNVI